MVKNIKIVLLILIAAVSFAGVLCAQEAAGQNVDVLMGLSIQSYLEGDMPKSIGYLDKVLAREPDNQRAKGLLEKAVKRLMADADKHGDYGSVKQYVAIAGKYLPESADVRKYMSKVGLASQEPAKKKEEKKQAVSNEKLEREARARAVAQRQASRLKDHVGKLEKDMAVLEKSRKNLMVQLKELKLERQSMVGKIEELSSKASKDSVPFWFILAIVVFSVSGIGFIYMAIRKEHVKVVKSIVRERQSVEDLRNAYHKDTEELARKLSQYGKSTQRATELEKNWEKVIHILETLTKAGSTNKLVLKNSPDGRKAVTGIDPRVRARADSVEIIAEIFRDSHRAPEMLQPFLDDPDNRTRANAAVAFYRYDPEKSLSVLKQMAASQDKWMRLSATWALGEINDASVTNKLLEQLLDDTDTQVKNRARVSLEKLLGGEGRKA